MFSKCNSLLEARMHRLFCTQQHLFRILISMKETQLKLNTQIEQNNCYKMERKKIKRQEIRWLYIRDG